MLVNIKNFLKEAGILDTFYPGKRLVKACKIPGEFKSHCVVVDWTNPEKIRLEVKAGISGKQLPNQEIKKYPVSFQSPTYVEIDMTAEKRKEDEGDEEGEGKASGGKGGSGGKKPLIKKKLEDVELITNRFVNSAEGYVPNVGTIKEIVVMGMKIAKDSFASVMSELTKQISHAVVATTELLAKASDLVTRVQPPSFLKPKGDETAKYKYDREKNADIGFRPSLS